MDEPCDYNIVFDGGCSGNPGQRYGSYQIKTKSGRARIERCKFGYGTNNEAEYLSLITALGDIIARCQQAKVPLERFTVHIKSDSQLVVNQVAGNWGVNKPELRILCNQVQSHLKNFNAWHIEWQPREQIVKVLGH